MQCLNMPDEFYLILNIRNHIEHFMISYEISTTCKLENEIRQKEDQNEYGDDIHEHRKQ